MLWLIFLFFFSSIFLTKKIQLMIQIFFNESWQKNLNCINLKLGWLKWMKTKLKKLKWILKKLRRWILHFNLKIIFKIYFWPNRFIDLFIPPQILPNSSSLNSTTVIFNIWTNNAPKILFSIQLGLIVTFVVWERH